MICPKCGNQLSDTAKFCGVCGTRLEAPAAPAPTAQAPQPTPYAPPAPTPVPPQQYGAQPPVNYGAQPPMPTPVPPQQYGAQQPVNYGAQPPMNGGQPPVNYGAQPPMNAGAQPPVNNMGQNVANGFNDAAQKAKEFGGRAADSAKNAFDSATGAVSKVAPGLGKGAVVGIVIGAVALVVVVLVVLFVLLGNGLSGSGPYTPDNDFYRSVNNDNELALIINGKLIKTDIEYGDGGSVDGGKGLYCFQDKLFVVNGEKAKVVEEEISNCSFSLDKSTAVFMMEKELYIYKGGSKKKIAELGTDSVNLAISPNGDTVIYAYTDEEEYVCYAYNGSKSKKLGKDLRPYAVSNKGSVAYLFDRDKQNFIAMKNLDKGKTVKICNDVNDVDFSADRTKVLVYGVKGSSDSASTYYYKPSMSEPIKVSSDEVNPIYPYYSDYTIKDFTNFVARVNGDIKRVKLKGKSFELTKIVSNYNEYHLSLDGKTIVFDNNERVYKISTVKANAEKIPLIDDVKSYSTNADMTKIYAINKDDELIFNSGKESSEKKIASDAENLKVDENGQCIYTSDKVLYTTGGGSGSKIKGMDDVTSMSTDGRYFYVWNDGTYYISKDGKSFTNTKIEKA